MQNNLTQILEIAKFKIDAMVENFIEFHLKPNKYNIVRPATDYDIKMYELDITIDLIKAFGRYIKPTDEVNDVHISSQKGVIVISCGVIREAVSYFLETEMIVAGGYNIQVRHYRYITKTKLHSLENNTAAAKLIAERNKLSKTQKINVDIAYCTKNYERNLADFNTEKSLSKNDIFNTRYLGADNIWENLNDSAQKYYETSEKYNTDVEKRRNEAWAYHLEMISDKRLKGINKNFEKVIKKLTDKLNNL